MQRFQKKGEIGFDLKTTMRDNFYETLWHICFSCWRVGDIFLRLPKRRLYSTLIWVISKVNKKCLAIFIALGVARRQSYQTFFFVKIYLFSVFNHSACIFYSKCIFSIKFSGKIQKKRETKFGSIDSQYIYVSI